MEWQLERHPLLVGGRGLGGIPDPASGQVRQDMLSSQEVEEMGKTEAHCTFYNYILYTVLQLCMYSCGPAAGNWDGHTAH